MAAPGARLNGPCICEMAPAIVGIDKGRRQRLGGRVGRTGADALLFLLPRIVIPHRSTRVVGCGAGRQGFVLVEDAADRAFGGLGPSRVVYHYVELLAAECGGEVVACSAELDDAGHVVRDARVDAGAAARRTLRVGVGLIRGVSCRILDAELRIGPDGVGCIPPEVGEVVKGLECVEDSAVGCFVDELQRNVLALSDLITKVDACGCDPNILFPTG